MVKFSDKGSGWYEQPGRHSRAKKFGTAGGTYAKRARHGGNKHLKKLTYKQLKAKKATLPARGDADGDKVKNARDCRPFDPKKQDTADQEYLQAMNARRAKEAHDKEVAELTKAMSKTKPSKIENSSQAIFKKEQWTEAEVNLIKNRLNSGKLKNYELPEDGVKLTPAQEKKGRDWLVDKWKTPRGIERKNNPFGNRETDVLEHFKEFRLIDFYDTANSWQVGQGFHFYVPYYRVLATDGGSFEYAVYGGEIHIMG